MALNSSMGLGFIFTARDLASAKMQKLEHRFASLDERVTGGTQRMNTAFRQLGIGLGVFTAGALGMASALSLANAAGRFEQGLAAVGAVTRATTQELGMLRDAAIEAGIRTQFSPDEAVSGLQSLATAGQTATQATRTLIPVLDLAAGSLGQLGVAQSAEAVVGTLNAYGMAAEEAGGVTDKLLRITQLTNFQTRDFEAGLAKAAASGSVFNQNLDDVLITMGLLRNRNIDASSSATAFREAVRRVGAESRAQQAIMGAGVQIYDQSSGQMRSIVDIMSDFAASSKDLSDKERNRRVVTAFGARGLLAFNAVLNASYTTMRDGSQVTLKGAEAIEALRKEMGAAEGTATQFREKLLDTFEGQKTLLRGTLETFAVVLGEPFAKVFKPVVQTLVDTLNAILRAFQSIPEPIEKVLAGVVTAASGFFLLVGAVIAVKATIGLLSIAFGALGVSIGGIAATIAPAVLMIGVLAAAVAALSFAFNKNLGGISDFAQRTWEKVTLLFKGLGQLFEQGGFSGAIREELNRAENQGLKGFLISIYQFAYRLGRVWQGVRDGFTSTIEKAAPVLNQLSVALSEMGKQIQAVFSEITAGAASMPSKEFASFGQMVGSTIATAVTWITRLITAATRFTTGIISGFRTMGKYVRPALSVIGDALVNLIGAWNDLTGATQKSTGTLNASAVSWKSFGEFLGNVLGGIVTFISLAFAGLAQVITSLIWAVNTVKNVFAVAGTSIGETAAKIYLWFSETIPNAIVSAVNQIQGFARNVAAFFIRISSWFRETLNDITGSIKSFIKPVLDFFVGVGNAIRNVIDKIREYVIRILREVPDALLPESLERLKRQPITTELKAGNDFEAISRTNETAARSEAATSSIPAASESRMRTDEFARFESGLMSMANSTNRNQGQTPPFTVNVQVDGETIARASHNASSDAAARAFSPVPVY